LTTAITGIGSHPQICLSALRPMWVSTERPS
jgi:hypothetical protein